MYAGLKFVWPYSCCNDEEIVEQCVHRCTLQKGERCCRVGVVHRVQP